MTTYILRRVIQGLIVLLAVSFVCFVIFRYMGDPVVSMAGQFAGAAEREEIRKILAWIDRPTSSTGVCSHMRCRETSAYHYIESAGLGADHRAYPGDRGACAHGHGLSRLHPRGRPRGRGFGRPGGWISRPIMGLLGGISIPTFLIGITLIMLFAVELGVLPPFGRGEIVLLGGWWSTNFLSVDGLKHLILPAFTLGMYQLAVLLRLTRSGMREVLTTEYIKTAWAKGLSPPRVCSSTRFAMC